MKNKILFFFALMHSVVIAAQTNPQITALNRFSINRNDTISTFYAKKNIPGFKIMKGKDYTWFGDDSLLVTREGYSGRLLDGLFTTYYPNKNLKEQGFYKRGLKTGRWRTWTPQGTLLSSEKWRKGDCVQKKDLRFWQQAKKRKTKSKRRTNMSAPVKHKVEKANQQQDGGAQTSR